MIKNKNILVTGATGYIGGTFTYEALKKGFNIIGIDNFINSSKNTLELFKKFSSFSFYEFDLSSDAPFIESIIEKYKISHVVHFAGLKAVGESERKQKLYWHNNLLSTLNLLESIKNKDIGLIFSSSATVYGETNNDPISETHKLNTTSAYGSTKLAQEMLISDYVRAFKLNCISLRYFNPVGSHSDYKIYENYLDYPNNLMPRVLRVAKGIDNEINIFGNDYDTDDGTGERDYIHISDLIDGHFSALDKVKEVNNHIFLNLGTGKKTSVLELIKIFEEVNRIKIKYSVKDRRPGDVQTCIASPNLANKLLSWKATRSIEDMCRDAWKAIENESK